MSNAVPPQIGATGLLVQGAPRFTGYVVQNGTWTMKDALKVVITRDGNSNVYNYTGYSPGEDDGCTLTIVKGNQPLGAMGLITENFPVHFPIQPTAAQTITVGAKTYHFVVATAAANDIEIGANLTQTAQNFLDAIMATPGAIGTTVGAGTTANLAATAVFDLQTLNTVLLQQITPWSPATMLQVMGTCGATISGMPITSNIIARTFVIQQDPETDKYGGEPLEQKVKLSYHADGFVPQTVT